ncbi:MAG: response regulator transcription factor [Chloroflexi bacterium]|nr:response regulator transcription factor [Chloroflexota bacterium]
MSPASNRADLKDSPKIRVLLVDDNEAFLRVATDFLQRHNELTVVGAICGGEEALAQAQDLGPQVILIGLDKPGLETISRLRKVLPGVGIIVLTLLEGSAYRQAVIAAGADDLVRKAELVTELLPAIRRVTQVNRSR